MNKSASTISVFAGPSGGHLFPAQAFAEALRKRGGGSFPYPDVSSSPQGVRRGSTDLDSRLKACGNDEWKNSLPHIHLITSLKAKSLVTQIDPPLFDQVIFLPNFPLPSGISLRTLSFLLKFVQAFINSYHYLLRTKPALSVGFGSYVSFPGLWLSSKMKIPTLIHEQNVIPGIAAARLKNLVDLVAVSFPGTRDLSEIRSARPVGLPLRSFLLEGASQKCEKEEQEPFRILVVGGSQGAHRLNQVVLETFSRFSSEEKKKIAVMHITGAEDYEWVKGSYLHLGAQAEVYSFSNRMNEHYQRADLALTRAGANTLFELALYELPALVVPYPHAGAHQLANAKAFENRGAVICREEKDLNEEWLESQIRDFMAHPSKLDQMKKNISELACPKAAEELADLALGLISKQEEACALSSKI